MTISAVIAGHAVNGTLNTIIGVSNLLSQDMASLKKLQNFSANNSLISLTEASRVEPLCIIGTDCVHLEYISDVVQSLQSIFAGYYLQAVAMTTQINGVSVTKILDKLNPDRKGSVVGAGLSVIDSTMRAGKPGSPWRLNSLAYEHRLPTTLNEHAVAFEHLAIENGLNQGIGDLRADLLVAQTASIKLLDKIANDKHQMDVNKHNGDEIERREKLKKQILEDAKNKAKPAASIINQDSIKSIREVIDLSVGKMLNVTFGGGSTADGTEIRSASIPISIRLMVNTMPEAGLVNLLATGSMDNSMKERYHAWRSGRIEFIRDLIFCQDLITENKKSAMHDSTGIQSEILKRVNNAKIAGIASRDPSLNVASNLYVISEVTATALEHKVGGKLSSASVRSKIFESGYAMIIVVIDRQWERISFYHRGISTYTTVNLRDLKVSNRGTGPDVAEILKAYTIGTSPSL